MTTSARAGGIAPAFSLIGLALRTPGSCDRVLLLTKVAKRSSSFLTSIDSTRTLAVPAASAVEATAETSAVEPTAEAAMGGAPEAAAEVASAHRAVAEGLPAEVV